MNNIVKIEQKPILDFSKMEEMGKEVENRLAPYTSGNLVVTEDNRKEIRKLRTELRKEFKIAENVRKEVRKQIEEPYKQFLNSYNDNIKQHYQEADETLKKLLFEVEELLREEKRKEVEDYFLELQASEKIDWLTFEDLNIKVNLSSSVNKLKEEITSKIDKVVSDLKLIETQEHKERILLQYQNTLDVNRSITTVLNQVEQEEQLAKQRAEQEEKAKQSSEQLKKQEEQKEKVEVLEAPKPQEKEPIYSMTFTVKGTKEELKMVKSFLDNNKIEYEG